MILEYARKNVCIDVYTVRICVCMQLFCAHMLSSHVVNSVQWAPHEWGLVLACGSADESVSFLIYAGEC